MNECEPLPVDIKRTRPPSLSRSLLNTILSQSADGGRPYV